MANKHIEHPSFKLFPPPTKVSAEMTTNQLLRHDNQNPAPNLIQPKHNVSF